MKILMKNACFALTFVCLSASTVFAQDDGAGRGSAPKRQKIKLDDDVYVIKGKIVKPQVQFIISREKGISEEAIDLKESFVPKILDSVQDSPF